MRPPHQLRRISTSLESLPSSSVARGIFFEQRSLSLLQAHLSMSLRRVGGKDDGGVDLQGWWWLPPLSKPNASNRPADISQDELISRRRLRVLAQCKAEKKKTGPNYVREMEGVLLRHLTASAHQKGASVAVALLISESQFTKAALLRALSSPVPFFMMHIPPPEETLRDSQASGPFTFGSAVWNSALGGQHGLLAGEMEVRWERAASGGGARPGLWWHGKPLRNWIPQDSETLDECGIP